MTKVSRFFFKYSDVLIAAGILLLILGLRISIGLRFVAEIPQSDDFSTIAWLQAWSQGLHNWAFIWQRHNGHPMELYYLANLGQYVLNGYWDSRWIFSSRLLFTRLMPPSSLQPFGTSCDRVTGVGCWVSFSCFSRCPLPAIASPGGCWPNSAMMAFAIMALYLTAYHAQRWKAVIFIIILAVLASFNFAAGCLGAFMVVGLALFRAILARRLTPQDATLSIVCSAIFLIQFLGVAGGGKVGLMAATNAFLKALAWPVVFIPGIGVLTLVPVWGSWPPKYSSRVFGKKMSPSPLVWAACFSWPLRDRRVPGR